MKTKIYITVLLTLVLFSACKKGQDLYVSPNSPIDVTPQVLLTALEVNTISNTEGDLARVSSILCEQNAGLGASQYQSLQNYDLHTNDYDNHWVGLYPSAMMNAHIMINKYQATDPYFTGMAQVLMAMNLGIATDLWGDVPYSKAFQGDKFIFTSAYDSQKDVLVTIQTLLDDAIANFAKSPGDNLDMPGSEDLYYGSDMDKWTKAAWTLKARYANRLSLKDPQGSATLVLQYLAKGITNPSDNMVNPHPDGAGSENQWSAYQNQRAGNMVVNSLFVSAMQPTGAADPSHWDPRLTYYVAQDGDGNYTGADITQETVNVDASTVAFENSGNYFYATSSFPIITSYETSFLKAEAELRLGTDPSTDLNDAINGSVDYVTKSTGQGASLATYTQATATLKNIITEKWKANFGQIEAYNDWRRTGFPALIIRSGTAGAKRNYIPVRLPTPTNESDGNPAAVYIELNVPVWWATATP